MGKSRSRSSEQRTAELCKWIRKAMKVGDVADVIDYCPHCEDALQRDFAQRNIYQEFLKAHRKIPPEKALEVLQALEFTLWVTPVNEAVISSWFQPLTKEQAAEPTPSLPNTSTEAVHKQPKDENAMSEEIPLPNTTPIATQVFVTERTAAEKSLAEKINTKAEECRNIRFQSSEQSEKHQIPIGAIIAIGPEGLVGRDSDLPWHCPADMAHFKRVTTGHVVVMGYNTFKSLGYKPLLNRHNVVVLDNDTDLDKISKGQPTWKELEERIPENTQLFFYRNVESERNKAYYEDIVDWVRRGVCASGENRKVWVIGGARLLAGMLTYDLIDELLVSEIPSQYLLADSKPFHTKVYLDLRQFVDKMILGDTLTVEDDDGRAVSVLQYQRSAPVRLSEFDKKNLNNLANKAYEDGKKGVGSTIAFDGGSIEELIHDFAYRAGREWKELNAQFTASSQTPIDPLEGQQINEFSQLVSSAIINQLKGEEPHLTHVGPVASPDVKVVISSLERAVLTPEARKEISLFFGMMLNKYRNGDVSPNALAVDLYRGGIGSNSLQAVVATMAAFVAKKVRQNGRKQLTAAECSELIAIFNNNKTLGEMDKKDANVYEAGTIEALIQLLGSGTGKLLRDLSKIQTALAQINN